MLLFTNLSISFQKIFLFLPTFPLQISLNQNYKNNSKNYVLYEVISQLGHNEIIEKIRQYCQQSDDNCFLVLQKEQKECLPKIYLLSYDNQKREIIKQPTNCKLNQYQPKQKNDEKLDFADSKTMKILLTQIKKDDNNTVLFFNKLKSKLYLTHMYQTLLNSILVICQTYQIDTLDLSENQFNDLNMLTQSKLLPFTQIKNLILNDNDISSSKSLKQLEQLDDKIKYISVYGNPMCYEEFYHQNSLNLQTKIVPNECTYEKQYNIQNIEIELNKLNWDTNDIDLSGSQVTFYNVDKENVKQYTQNLFLIQEIINKQIQNSKLPNLQRYVQVSAQYVYQNDYCKVIRYLELEIPAIAFKLQNSNNVNKIYDVVTIVK